jgi:Rrf2 family protein
MFSRSAKYAVMALVELAARGGKNPVQIRELARAAGIPYPFLSKLVPPLVRAGILSSTRGKKGGVRFARPPAQVSLAQVIRAVEGDAFFQDCPFVLSPCQGKGECALSPVWDPVREKITKFLEETTLAEIAEKRGGKDE